MDDITALRAAIAAGPSGGAWQWELNMQSKSVHIVGGRGRQFDLTVMDFERWGMSSAAPRFNEEVAGGQYNVMTRLPDMPEWRAPFPGRAHHADWCQDVTHPDARWMVTAYPDRIGRVLDALEASQAECARLRAALELAQWADYDDSDWGLQTFCPVCRADKRYGHAEGCEIGAAIATKEPK